MAQSLPWQQGCSLFAACALAAFVLATTANARDLGGVPPVVNPQSNQDCQDLSMRWYEKRKELESANRVCERRDGGTIRASGVWMPNCNARQQAYVSCASYSDQLCWVDNQQREAVATCHRDLAAHQKAVRDRETASRKLQNELEGLQKARERAAVLINEGPAAALLKDYVTTPGRAAETFQDNLKDAARTTGTRHPDSQPELNRSGAASDIVHRAITPNAAIAEIGSQSAGAARARMGDAMNQLDGALNQAASERLPSNTRATPSGDPVRAVAQRSQGYDAQAEQARRAEIEEQLEEQRQAAARLEQMRQLSQAIQQATDAVNASRGGGSTYAPPIRSGSPAAGPRCREREVVGPNVDRSLPYCR